MQRPQVVSLCFVVAVGAFGCSGGDSTGGRAGSNQSRVGAPSGPAGTGSGTGTGFGNSSGGVPMQGQVPMTTAPDAGAPGMASGTQPISIDDCGANSPAGVSQADATKLKAGGAGSVRVLYPYDGTVFPRGTISPTLMWDGGGDFVYVHIKSMAFEYWGCLKPTGAGQLQIPQDVWDKATARTYGPSDPYAFELNVMTGGNVQGPATFKLTLAQATIKGSIYYNSYSSQLASGGGLAGLPGGGGGPPGLPGGGGPPGIGGQGAVLRIPNGKSAEVFLNSSGCNACHSVSANGSRIVSLPLGIAIGGPADSASYALAPGATANPNPLASTLANAAFVGLSPDGSLYVTSAHQNGVGPRPGSPATIGGPTASLYATDTGMEVTGSGVPMGAMTPMFSPDGTQLAFTDAAIDGGHGMAVMKFDLGMRVASEYRKVFATGDAKYPAWPFFLPDGKALTFAIGEAADFSGNGAGLAVAAAVGAAGAPASDVYLLDLASGKQALLARAMGFASEADAASGTTYLPFGAEELHHHYYPTVAPVAAGGYFWVFFDSLRHYGNQGLQRQIWGAAVDISASGDYSMDRSHPAFYLPGQEPNTGNHRAFAALDPCKKDGDDCTTGIDCCGGTCYVPGPVSSEFGVEQKGSCMKPPEKTCAKRDERCVSTSDCCPPEGNATPNSCIAGFCAQIHVQ
jgi:hypothetical protein